MVGERLREIDLVGKVNIANAAPGNVQTVEPLRTPLNGLQRARGKVQVHFGVDVCQRAAHLVVIAQLDADFFVQHGLQQTAQRLAERTWLAVARARTRGRHAQSMMCS